MAGFVHRFPTDRRAAGSTLPANCSTKTAAASSGSVALIHMTRNTEKKIDEALKRNFTGE
jgi:hypothetical protein